MNSTCAQEISEFVNRFSNPDIFLNGYKNIQNSFQEHLSDPNSAFLIIGFLTTIVILQSCIYLFIYNGLSKKPVKKTVKRNLFNTGAFDTPSKTFPVPFGSTPPFGIFKPNAFGTPKPIAKVKAIPTAPKKVLFNQYSDESESESEDEEFEKKITELLNSTFRGLTSKEIAKKIKCDKKKVNSFLYRLYRSQSVKKIGLDGKAPIWSIAKKQN